MLERIAFLTAGLGIGSIAASIATWYKEKGDDPIETAHAERFGIFVGLWPPTFLALTLVLLKLKDMGYERDVKKIRDDLEQLIRDKSGK
jgi:hypothetical protein